MRLLLFVLLSPVLLTSAATAGGPTYADNVAAIINKNCVSCHRPGEIAPFSLTNYKEVSSRASMIAAVTASRQMPPWKGDENYGEHLDRKILSEAEIELLAEWAASGAPEGDPSRTPRLPDFPEGSQLGTPDLVLEMPEDWEVLDNYKDVYRNFVLPTNLVQGRQIAAVEFRPGNAKVVHHALMWIDESGQARRLDAQSAGQGYPGFGGPGFNPKASIGAWVPGQTSRFYPPGMGISVGPNADVLVQIHYAPSTTLQKDRSRINIFFKNESNMREISEGTASPSNLVQGSFIIAPNTTPTFLTSLRVPYDISLISVAPHMHLLGSEARAWAISPTKDTIKLVHIPEWDFNWQGYYRFRRPVKIPSGSTIFYSARYDNTASNPSNPSNPPKLVQWGEGTEDEMLLSYFHFVRYRNGDENLDLESSTTSVSEEGLVSGIAPVQVISTYPSPAIQNVTVSVFLPREGTIDWELSDLLGSSVLTSTMHGIAAGRSEHSIALPAIAPGTYILRARSHGVSTAVPITVAQR